MMNDYEKVYETFKALSHAVPFKPNNWLSPYPLFNGNFTASDTPAGGLIEVTSENYHSVVEQRANMAIDYARKSKEPMIALLIVLTSPYYMQFLYFIKDYVTPETIGECLAHCWVDMEFPNQHACDMLLELFDKADKKALMSEEEYEKFSSLPETVEIYRGIQSKKAKVKAMSWTLSLDKAKWFANRWGQNNKVVKVLMPKRNILAYFKGRGEEEIVINPKRLTKIAEV